ncbi:MAG TPA: MarR family transcriptional regulator [Gammaproteobacteria bacterium]|nr:MarR family transcriptional regulator [Gammaproteobacteria bacterium]
MADLPVSTVYLLKRAELAVRGCVEVALSPADLTPSQYFILFLVKSGEATSSAELARSMGVLPQSMTELIAPLEKNGAIVRKPDPANNRILRIEMTAAGERLFAKGTEVAIRIEQELLDGFDARELAAVNRFFGELTAKAESHSFHPKLRRLTKVAAKAKALRTAAKRPARRRARRA